MKYNWQYPKWPDFRYELSGMEDLFLQFTEKTGRVDGLLSALPDAERNETMIDLMVSEAMKSSEIEGEMLSRPDVLSSIRKNLGLRVESSRTCDRRAEGIAKLMICVRNGFASPLSRETLFEWHRRLMKGSVKVRSGAWRTHAEPMLILSGTIGNETVHFEAPPSRGVPREMKQYIQWFNRTAPGEKDQIRLPPVRSAIAHLYFESIHPFEDGNGRIGRALSEKALSQGIGRPILLSLSQAIEADRAGYYAALKEAQQSLDITGWVLWFARTLLKAQRQAESLIEFTLKKTRLFDRVRDGLNDRQGKALRRMLEAGPGGFHGGMSAKKYMAITKASKPTATRDLQDLAAKGILVPFGGGRSTRYQLDLG